MSFHRGFYQNSTQKKTKTLQAKPILLQAKPFRPFKRSSTQVRRLTIAMVADLSYIPWDDPPLVPHFPFSNQTQRYQSLEAMLQNELRVPGETSRVTRPPRFFWTAPLFSTQKNAITNSTQRLFFPIKNKSTKRLVHQVEQPLSTIHVCHLQ